MKHALTTLAAFSALGTAVIFIALVYLFVVAGGSFNIVLPGPGLVISGSLVLAALLIFGAIMFVLTVWLVRRIRGPLR